MSLTQMNHDTSERSTSPHVQAQIDVVQANTSLPPLATTNYGSQVAYNYGTISNYFCQNDAVLHYHDFPRSNQTIPGDGPVKKLEQARRLLAAERYVESKTLLYDVLFAEETEADDARCAAVKFSLGCAHFSVAEYTEALSHFEAVIEWTDLQETFDTTEEVGTAPYWLGRCHFQLKNYTKASAALHAFISSQEASTCPTAGDVTHARLWLGLTLDCLGSHEAARDQLHSAWHLQEQASGAEHLDTLVSRHHLANLCFKQKLYTEARVHFEWLLEAEERLTGPEKSQALITRIMLAFTICELDQIELAVPHLQRALSRIESQSSLSVDDNCNLGLVRYWVGRDHLRQRQYDKARDMFQRSLMLLTQEQEPADKFLDCQLYMGVSLCQLREYQAAGQILERILQSAREREYGDTIMITYWLATTLISQRKYEEARDVLDDIIITADVIYASKWTGADSAACLYRRGEIHFNFGNYSEARNCFKLLVDIEPVEPNSFTTCYRFWMGKTLFELEHFEEARPFFQTAYDLCQHGSDLVQGCVDCISWLAWTVAEVNEADLAETYLRRTMQYFPHIPAKPTRKSDTTLGRTKYYLGKSLIHKDLKEATKLLRESVVMLARSFGDKNSIYLQCRYHLARCLLASREYDQAQAILQEFGNLQHESRIIQTICNFLAPYRTAHIHMQLSKFSEAREILLKCLTAWDETAASETEIRLVKHDLAFCELKIGNLEACIDELKPVVDNINWEDDDQKPTNFKLINYLGRALYFSYRYAEAAPLLEKYLGHMRTLPTCATTKITEFEAYLADCYCETGRQKDAHPILTSGALLNKAPPGTALGYCRAICKYWSGRLAITNSKYDEAEKCLVETLRLLGNRQWLYSVRMRHACRFYLADVYLKRKQYSEAEVMFTDLLDHPIKDYFSVTMTDIQFLLGLAFRGQTKYSEAKDMFMAALPNAGLAKLMSNMVQLCQYHLGGVTFKLGKFTEAEQYLRQAAYCEGSFDHKFDARRMIGNCKFHHGDLEEAREVFQSLIIDDGVHTCCLAIYKFLLGRTLHRLRQFEEAGSLLEYALEKLPSNSEHKLECHFLAADIAFSLKKYSRSVMLLSTIRRARNLVKSDMNFKTDVLLARCYLKMEDLKEASELFSTCLEQEILKSTPEIEQERKIARLYYAKCLQALGKAGQARRELESIVEYLTTELTQDNPIIVLVNFELADIAYTECRFQDAACLLKQALQDYQRMGSVAGFDVWHCRLNLGHVFMKIGLHEDAITIYRQFYRRKLADSHMSDIYPSSADDVWHTLRQNKKHSEALALAQERIAMVDQRSKAGTDVTIAARIDLTDVAFDLHDWQMVIDTASEVAVHIDDSSEAGKFSAVNLSKFFAEYSFALRMVERHEESKQRGLQAVNTGRRKPVIQSVEDTNYAAAFVACLGFDPSEIETDTESLSTRSKLTNTANTAHNAQVVSELEPDFSEVIAYGEVESRALRPGIPISETSTSAVTVTETSQASPTALTPRLPPSPMRLKPPRPPKPPKPPGLSVCLATQLRTQTVQ